MDATIVNVALPRSGASRTLAWPSCNGRLNAYTIVVAQLSCCSLLRWRIASVERKNVPGRQVFSVGSSLCSIARTARAPVAGPVRFRPVVDAQSAMFIIVNMFLDLKERARAVGVWEAAFGVAMAAGPLMVACSSTASAGARSSGSTCPSERSPVLIVAASRANRERSGLGRFDFVAQVLVITALFASTLAVIDGIGHQAGRCGGPPGLRHGDGERAGFGVSGTSHRGEPLLDPRLLRASRLPLPRSWPGRIYRVSAASV